MRLDYINNMRNIYRQEKLRNYRRTVIFFLSVGVMAYLAVLVTIMTAKRDESAVSGQVAVTKFEGEVIQRASDAPSASASPTPADVKAAQPSTPAYRPAGLVRHTAAQPASSPLPQQSFRSTSNAALTVHTTSSATVKNIGGGGSTAGATTRGTSVTTSSSTAFSTSTSIMVLPTLARASSRNLNAANTLAAEAEIIENTATDRAAKPGIKRVDGHPLDPFMDPVGDALLPLILLALAYGSFILYRRRQRL